MCDGERWREMTSNDEGWQEMTSDGERWRALVMTSDDADGDEDDGDDEDSWPWTGRVLHLTATNHRE